MTDSEKLIHIAEQMPEVYKAGQKSEYDRFWDTFQRNGDRRHYSTAFTFGWVRELFKPKYDIRPTSSGTMFGESNIEGDLVEILSECGVTLDFSDSVVMSYLFTGSKFTRVGDIVTSKASNLIQIFFSAKKLHTIDKLVLKEDGTQTFNSSFGECIALENISVEGKIGRDIDFKSCPLTPASMKSIITHLANYAGTANEGKYTVTFTETCWTALEADSTAPDGGTWKEYTEGTLGWLT